LKKKILITGITGMLGSAVLKTFQVSNNYEIFGVSRNSLNNLKNVVMFYGDLSDKDFMNSFKTKFDIIIHCSAEVNVNLCETDKVLAFNSNVVATENLVLLSPKLIVYISTDSVFDGQIGGYVEESNVNPLNYYAKTKLLGEKAIEKNKFNFLILRTNIYGFNQPMKNSLFEWAYKELKEQKSINGFSNMYFNPLYVGQIAELLYLWVQLEIEKGIYNIGSENFVSKYEFLNYVLEVFDFDKNQLKSVLFDNKQCTAPRALDTTLDISKTKKAVNNFDFSLKSGIIQLKNDIENLSVL
jgi:dTDP-4-dehydrorhamnose reductase